MQQVKIITDSSCDLDLDYLKKLNVEMCPLTTTIDGEDFLDRIEISPSEFYKRLESAKEQPKTSQVTPAYFVTKFKKAIEDNMEVLYIGFSSKLSGTYQSAVIAKDMVDNSEKIEVIDTLAASIGQGLIVEKAAIMATEGKSRDEISKEVYKLRDKMEHIVGVGSLEMLKKGGRISPSQAAIGSLLNVKPILHIVDGSIEPLEKVRGKKAIIKRFLDILDEKCENIEKARIGISYSKDIEIANELKEKIKERFKVDNFLISEIGAVIGSHVGASTIVLFFLKK